MRSARALAVMVVLAASVAVSASAPPLVGRWQWPHANGCTEIYEFRSDGTARVTSGDETTDERYELSPSAEGKGRYKLTMTTVKDHGGKDCVGSVADTTGKSTTGYVEMNSTADVMVFCVDATSAKCMGPLRRVGPPLR